VGHDVVVIGGGIGFAPLRPVVERIAADRSSFGETTVVFGARSPDDVLFKADLDRWRREDSINVQVTVDAAGPDWHGNVGVVTPLLEHLALVPEHTAAFICGPEPVLRFATRALHDRGVALEHIQLSAERNMQCAIAQCGHCQLGDALICRDGPVMTASRLLGLMRVQGR